MELLELDPELLPTGSSLLHLAANNEDASRLRELLERDSSLIDGLDCHNRTPLAVALHNGRVDAARTLIEFGASLEVPFEKDGQTILQLLVASAITFQPLFESIIEHNVAITFAPSFLFPIAAFEGKVDILEKLLSRYEVDVNYKDSLQRTALHYACQSGDIHCISLLLQYRASKLVTDLHQSTPLHLACTAGHLEAVQALLEDTLSYEPHLSALNSQDAVGCTPVHTTLYCKQFGVMLYLLVEFRADLDLTLVDSNGYSIPSLLFSLRCSFGVIPPSYEQLLPCLSQEEATWLLHESVSRQDLELVMFSITQGAAVDCCDFMWQTPLLFASKLGSVKICRHLVEQGASLNVCDPGGKCPLQYAAEMGHLEIVSFFLSLPEVDPTPVYARYSHPLSPGLLQLLLDFFQRNPLAPKPQNWLKWLTLAAPSSSGSSFSHLVGHICPSGSWIEALASGEVCSDDQITVVAHQIEKSILPIYTENPKLEGEESVKPHKTCTRGSKKWKRRSTRKPQLLSTPKGFLTQSSKKKKVPKRVLSKFKGKPFTFLQKHSQFQYYPLHTAVQCGNTEVIDFLLSAAERQGVQSQLLQLRDDSKRTVSELVAGTFMPLLPPDLEKRLNVRMEEYCPLPDGVIFEEALLHYLLVGGPSRVKHIPHSKVEPSVTPLDNWPQRCVQEQIFAYAKKLGTAPVSLLSEEDRQSFLKLILEWSSLPLDRALGPYPCLLYTAVQWKCVWGVRLLLYHGAPVTAQAGNQYALLEAAKQCQVEIIDLLLQNGFVPFLQMSDLGHLCESLCPHLVTLANQGLFQSVKKLTDGLPVKEYLWGLPSGPRLLYVTLALGELDLGICLMKSFVSFLCTAIANWQALDGTFHSNVTQCLKRLQCGMYLHTFRKVRHGEVRLFAHLIAFSSTAIDLGLLFHSVCGLGFTEVVRLMLECAKESSVVATLVTKLDSKKRSPLFYAACGGHLDIIKLLISDGSALYSPSSKAPILGLLLYFCGAPHAQEHSAEHCGKSGRKLSYRTRHAFLTSTVADLFPRSCHFSLAFKNLDQARQLTALLMPTSDKEWAKVLVLPQTRRKAAWFNPLWLAASITKPTLIEPILKQLFDYLSANISIIETNSEELLVSHYPVVAPVFLSKCSAETPATILDAAIMLAPFNDGSTSSATFQGILAQYASTVPLHELDLASRKGYWGVVQAALSSMSCDSQLGHAWRSYQVSNPEILKQCQKILSLASKQGEIGVIEALLSAARQNAGVDSQYPHPSKRLKLNLFEGAIYQNSTPLCLAVKHNHLDALMPLVDASDDLVAGLQAAARWNRMDALNILLKHAARSDLDALAQCIDKLVCTAAHHNRTKILECLLPQYENPELMIGSDHPDRNMSFWFQVLLESAKHGHEGLSLQAMGCFSDSQLDQLTNHRRYCDILYWACYWGMSDLLECLPFVAPELLERLHGGSSPWECAIANGHIGRLSSVPNFPQLPGNLDEWLEDSPLGVSLSIQSESRLSRRKFFLGSLFSGCFHRLCSGKYGAKSSPEVAPWLLTESLTRTLVNDTGGLELFHRAVVLKVPHIVEVYLQNLGSYAGMVLRLLQTELSYPVLHHACSNGGSKEVLEPLLQALFKANLLTEALQDLSETKSTPLVVAIKSGSVSCTKAILRCGPLSLMQHVDTVTGDTLLHLAVRSKNAELVELILQSLGEKAPDSCFTPNNAGNYPLLLAFVLGCHRISPLLLTRAMKSSKWNQNISPDWWKEAKLARGWFQLLMENSSLLTLTSPQSDLSSCEMNIRLTSDLGPVRGVFIAAVKNQHTLMVRALLSASSGLLLDRSMLPKVRLEPAVLDRLAEMMRHGDQSELADFYATRSAITALHSGRSSEVMQLVKLVSSSHIPLILDIKTVFLAACNRGQLDLIQNLLHSSERKVKTALDSAALKEGIAAAVACGSFDTAAYLQLETNLPFKKELIPEGARVSPLVSLIFSCNTSYFSLVKKFFESVASSDTNRERLPFSAIWLRHKWTAYQYQLVMSQMGGGAAPPNPWSLPVTIGEDIQTISLNIDWDSFTECFVGSPIVEFPTAFQEVPLLIEATIFSPSVLGQLYCGSENPDSPNINSILPLDSPVPSSLILSSVVCPQEPTISVSPDGLGLLTLSYQPEERTFLFPISSISEAAISFSSSDSGIQSFAYSPESCQYPDHMDSLVQHTSESLNRASKGKYSVHVGLADGFPHITNCNTFAAVFQAVQTALKDCTEILELIRCPAVLYSHLKPGIRPSRLPHPPEAVFSSVHISLSLENSDYKSPVEVSMEHGHLSINVNIDPAGSPDNSMSLEVPPFEVVLTKVTDCMLLAELEKLKLDLMTTLPKKVVAKLQRSLKGRLEPDAVSVLIQDRLGATHKLDDLTMEHFLHLKELRKVRRFLTLFSEILQVMSYKPRLLSSIRTFFDAGFRIVISESDNTGFTLKAGVPQLTVSTDVTHRSTVEKNLLSTFASMVTVASVRRQSIPDFGTDIPAPFVCSIDWEKSMGLLYPAVGAKGHIVVQLVSYSNQKLSELPKSKCCLDIVIKGPTEKLYRASSSEDPSPHSASKFLITRTKKEGMFEVEWTPDEEGIHLVSVSVNNIRISSSPFKAFVGGSDSRGVWTHVDFSKAHQAWTKGSCGSRHTNTDVPLVFIAAHPPLHCSYHTQSPVTLINRKSIIRSLTSSSSSSSSKPTEKSGQEGVERFFPSTGDPARVHYLSVTSAGGSEEWEHIVDSKVSIFISSRGHPYAHFLPLGNGFYRIVLHCLRIGTFKIFAACAICQCVMEIHWVDQRAFHPLFCYILPGPFSPRCSSLSIKKPKSSQKPSRKLPIGGPVGSFSAGSTVTLYLRARDDYSNAHTTGGAVQKVVIKGAGRRQFNPNAELAQLVQEYRMEPPDVECSVDHIGNGLYQIECQVFTAGNHSICITDQCGTTKRMGTLEVLSGSLHAPLCRLDPRNSYQGVTTEYFVCYLYAFDQFLNPCSAKGNLASVRATVGNQAMTAIPASQLTRGRQPVVAGCTLIALQFTPYSKGMQLLNISVGSEVMPACPVQVNIVPLTASFPTKLKRLRNYLKSRHCVGYTPTVTINREDILESAVRELRDQYFHRIIRVRFGDEVGIDTGGVSREFFHLLCQEFINPQYALFQCVNGLYRPSPNSSINLNHLFYFNFFGKFLAKTICDGHQMTVRFTPAVYKFLLHQECVLDDLKIEDPSLYMSLVELQSCESQEALEQLAMTFTASRANFGALETVELERGGEERNVTLENKEEFVNKLYKWQLTGCIREQLGSLTQGFTFLVPSSELESFSAHELEVVLSGQPTIDLQFLRSRATFSGYSARSDVVQWLWEVLAEFSQEQRCQFLQFTTGCACLPAADTGQWELHVKRGSNDSSLLPVASTCFNAITLPHYTSKNTLKQKLELAISYGQQTFLLH